VTYTEYGKMKMRLTAPLLARYLMAPEPYSVFPDGFFVEFFTPEEVLESQITADYGLYKEKPVEIWRAVGNVVVINYEKQQKLLTDTLYWNRQEHTIYTTAPVRIETNDGTINGRDGMISDEHFTNYEIREISESHYFFDDQKNGER
jgi:LPS export ABC transporter protein LptC